MNNKNVFFSIITPIYNGEKYLKKMIESVLNQTYQNFELILINDGSSDNSLKICNKYSNLDSRIIVIDKKNSGVSDTRNLGIKTSKGKYICFLDADDYYDSDYLKYIYNEVNNKNEKAELVCCGFNEVDCTDSLIANSKSFQTVYKNKEDIVFTNYGGYVWNKCFLRDILINNKILFKTNIYMCEDMLFIVEYMAYINSISLISKKLYNYRVFNESLSKKMSNKKWFTVLDSMIEIEKKAKVGSDFYKNIIFFKYFYCTAGLYRLHFIDDEVFNKDINILIRKIFKNYKKQKKYLNLFQKMKIFMYRYFGFIFFKIKR